MPLILRERASRHALYGVAIAIAAVILATLLVSVHVYDGITIDNVVRAHRENMALWILNALPFIYAAWGQYASMSMARMARSMIQQRTEALKREMEKIEESARLRTDFLARVSHELRTPLNAIIGMAQLLDEGDLDRRRRRRVEVIRESAEGLLTMINDLLDFSRMESGQVELDEVEFNLRESLDGAVKLVAPEAERKGLDLRVELAEDMPTWVSGDPGRLRQIVINLLGNAIKFTEAGHVALRLGRWERAGEARVRLIFEVVDTGPGIDPTDVERLFEPYTRGREEGGGRYRPRAVDHPPACRGDGWNHRRRQRARRGERLPLFGGTGRGGGAGSRDAESPGRSAGCAGPARRGAVAESSDTGRATARVGFAGGDCR